MIKNFAIHPLFPQRFFIETNVGIFLTEIDAQWYALTFLWVFILVRWRFPGNSIFNDNFIIDRSAPSAMVLPGKAGISNGPRCLFVDSGAIVAEDFAQTSFSLSVALFALCCCC